MDDHMHVPLFLTSIVAISFFLTTTLPRSLCQQDNKSAECGRPYSCGGVSGIYYPFWGQNRPSYCGGDEMFRLTCEGDQNTSIQVGSQSFQVLQIQPLAYTMTMVRTGLAYDRCSSSGLTNNSLNSSLFRYSPNVKNVTIFYDCPSASGVSPNTVHSFRCMDDGSKSAFYVEEALLPEFPELQKCEGVRIEVQVSKELGSEVGIEGLKRALGAGFEVNYTSDGQSCVRCLATDGTCGTNDKSQFTCYCRDGTEALDCYHQSNEWDWKTKIGIGVAAAVVSALVVGTAFYIYERRKKNLHAISSIQSQRISSDPCLEELEEGNKCLGIHLFTYRELEEATNHFDSARELGDGGFGTVYFGKLGDGRHVAVKRLYESNYRRVEQFLNEVGILIGLRHQNLVSLYGCTSRHSRELLLVYEYIPNGTVADHLHGQRAQPGTPPWHIRMNIAVEAASALAYLHASDIIHRDVKTNNILLDNHFRVKVADFGLSRLFPIDVTHISTAPQGTPGYVDPEYHEYYQLTDKSDVYSFGVVLIELISSMPAVDISRHRHEINLSHMAINKIRNGALHELVDPTLGFESDFKVRKMVNAVAELAFQCLQSSKDMRPSMAEVLDMLRDIQSDGKFKCKPDVMDILADDAVLLKNEPPPPSPDSNLVS